MDDTSIYSSRINLALDRLHLRSELYKIPENIDDRVGIIIEQAGKTTNGNKNKQRALLIDACSLLAQDSFQVVLDAENPNGKYFRDESSKDKILNFSNWKNACKSNGTIERFC